MLYWAHKNKYHFFSLYRNNGTLNGMGYTRQTLLKEQNVH